MDIYETWYINKMQPKLNIEKIFNYSSQYDTEKYNSTFKQRAEHKAAVRAKLDICLESRCILI